MESIFESDEPPLDWPCVWQWRCDARSLPEGEHLPHLVPPACSVTLYPHRRERPRPSLIKHLVPSSHVNSYDFFFLGRGPEYGRQSYPLMIGTFGKRGFAESLGRRRMLQEVWCHDRWMRVRIENIRQRLKDFIQVIKKIKIKLNCCTGNNVSEKFRR